MHVQEMADGFESHRHLKTHPQDYSSVVLTEHGQFCFSDIRPDGGGIFRNQTLAPLKNPKERSVR